MTSSKPRAAIYTRISKDKDGDAHGVANQLAACEKHAKARGWQVVARLSDNDISASNGKHRPGYDETLSLVRGRQVDVVLVWAVDRLVRRMADMEPVISLFTESGVTLASVTGDLDLSTDTGRLVARILGSVAQGEVERKSARQKMNAEAAARGGKRWTGCPRPFGYADDHVTPDPVESGAVADACTALLAGSNLSEIARQWDAAGLVPPQHERTGGKRWSRQSVRMILTNRMIAGQATYRGDLVAIDDGAETEWAQLVPLETFEAVQHKLAPAPGRSRGQKSLLGGIARCACGNKITGSTVHKTRQHIYRCEPISRDGSPGPHTARSIAPVDEYVTDVIVGRLARKDAAELIMPPSGVDVAALREQQAALRARLDDMAADFADGVLSRSQLGAGTKRVEQRLGEIGTQLAEAGRHSALTPLVMAENARAVWDRLDLARRRAVVRELITVTVLPPGQGSRSFDESTVKIAWRV